MDRKAPAAASPCLAGLPAEDLRRMILAGDISVPELVAAALAAIGERDGGLNAFAATCPDRAMDEARAAQRRLGAGGDLPPLFGLPLAVKDSEPVAGLPFACGSLVHHGRVAAVDSLHVARLRAAGAIVVGKTSTPEFTLLGETRNRLGPDTCNPWDRARTPGGSSGGSAAAVAAGMVPLATGSDTAGSITVPAALCGLAGLKPSHRRIPVWPGAEDWQPYADVGPMARSVAGLALMFAAAADPDAGDPVSAPPPVARAAARRLRVSWAATVAGRPVDGDCVAAAGALAALMAAAGHAVDRAAPDLADPGPVLDLLGAVEEYRARGGLLDRGADLLVPETRAILELGRSASPDAVASARATECAIAGRFRAFMAGRDLFILPATACPAFPLRRPPDRIDGRAVRPDWPSYAPFNMLANLSGLPVATLPVRLTAGGLPLGALVFANFGQDETLLAALAAAEALRGPFPAAPLSPAR